MRPLILALTLVLATSASTAGRDPFIEEDVLTFALPDLEGRTVSSSDPALRGKVLLIDLWATWCPPCISEIPTFVDLQERYGEQGLVIVAIAFESDDDEDSTRADRLREFVEHHSINYLVLDGGPPEEFATALPQLKNVRGFPVEVLIGRDGTIVDVRNSYGYKKKWARKLERELAELLDTPVE